METGISFEMIKNFVKKIWLFIVIGMIMGGILGIAINKIKGKTKMYQATSSIFLDRNFDVDANGNGFYDGDSGRFWANFMAFSKDPNFVDQLEEDFPDYQESILEKNFSEGSNLFQISYKSEDKNEAMGIVNSVLKQVSTEAEKYLNDKVKIVNTTEATSDNVIESQTGSTKTDGMIGVIYGLIIGLVIGIGKLFLKKR